MATNARLQFEQAKRAAPGVSWLVGLARRGAAAPDPSEQADAITMLQVERLEAQLYKLGTLHNRDFSAQEREIREGLKGGNYFERSQVQLGEHIGFIAGKKESDASPDPWWIIGNLCIVFEDHANAKQSGAVIDATKARQAASHPDWIRTNVAGAANAEILPVLVTPADQATEGAIPRLQRVAYWPLDEFRTWADEALVTVRELRRSFVEPGDIDWRAQAATALRRGGLDAPGLFARLRSQLASEHLKVAS